MCLFLFDVFDGIVFDYKWVCWKAKPYILGNIKHGKKGRVGVPATVRLVEYLT